MNTFIGLAEQEVEIGCKSINWEAIAIRRKHTLSPDFFERDCAYIGDTNGKADDYHNILMRTREMDIESKRQAWNNLRQPILVTTTAGIGLSVYQLLPLAVCLVQKHILYTSWVSFIMSFISVVYSYKYAHDAYEEKIAFTDNQIRLRNEKNEEDRQKLINEMKEQWAYIEDRSTYERDAIDIGLINFLLGVVTTAILVIQVL